MWQRRERRAAGLTPGSSRATPAYPARSANPSPLAAHKVIPNRLRSAAWPVVPHRGASARVFFVKPPPSGSQAGAAFIGQRVGVDRRVPKFPRGTPSRSIQHRARVTGAIGAESRHLRSLAIVQARRYRAANDCHPAQHAILIGHANAKPVAYHRAAVPVQLADKLVCGLQVARHNAQTPNCRVKRIAHGWLRRGFVRRYFGRGHPLTLAFGVFLTSPCPTRAQSTLAASSRRRRPWPAMRP